MTTVSYVTSRRQEPFRMEPIMEWVHVPQNPREGSFRTCGLPGPLRERLAASGVSVDHEEVA